MFGFKKKDKTTNEQDSNPTSENNLERGLDKTRKGFFSDLGKLFSNKQGFTEEQLDEIEDTLLMADVGIDATQDIISKLKNDIKRQKITDGDSLQEQLKQILTTMLEPVYEPLTLSFNHKPEVILMVGVNGVGKTTTIGKLAKKIQAEDHSVMLAAGDTFRAAAIEQLTVWGERNNIPVISQSLGADAAAVIFDALESAKAKHIDVLIADTAGRLHTKDNLMEELKKVRRVLNKFEPELEPEVLLVLDATTGQNALLQAKQFHQDIGINGIVLSKLDGTAKGGIIFALANELTIPIRFIGVGESIEDLTVFEPKPFVEALMGN